MKPRYKLCLLVLGLFVLAALVCFPAAEASRGVTQQKGQKGKAQKQKAGPKRDVDIDLPGKEDADEREVEADDPDLPRQLRGKINEEEYLRARTEYFMTKLGMEPGKPYSPALREQAVKQMKAQEARQQRLFSQQSSPFAPLLSATTWTNIGPYPIPNGQTSGVVQAVSGRTISIAIHPTNPDIVYVGTAQGGLYRSTNGGTTWTQLFNNADSQVIGALALAPSNPEILYVGTGENGQCGSGCYAGVGVYRVDNASTTADLTGPINPLRNYNDATNAPVSANVFTGRSISKILVNPTDPSIIFVGTASAIVGNPQQTPQGNFLPPLGIRGLYRLANATGPAAGVTATKLTVSATNCFDTPCTGNLSVLDLAYDGNDATGNTFVCWLRPTTGTEGGVYRTTNALTTATFTNTLLQTSTANARGEIASVTIAGTTTMYLANGESSTGRIRRSTDGGQTWSAILAGASGFCGGQCFYDIAIAIDPLNASIAYVGGAAGTNILRRTTDGFATAANTPSRQTGLHADDHVIAVANAPNNNIVYDGNDGGIWRSTDSATSWTSLNNSTFSATQFQSISNHPVDRWFSIGGTQDNGTNFLQPNAPALPAAGWTHADFGDGGYARIDQTAGGNVNAVTMYHTYFNQTNNLIGFARVSNVSCATDGNWAFKGVGAGVFTNACGDIEGANGITATDTVLFYAPLELGPVAGSTGQTVYFGTDRLYRSINRGDTVTVVSNAGAPAALTAGVPITTVGISPTDDACRIVGLNNGSVFATTTGGAIGAAMTNVTPPGMAATRAVGRVIIDPNDHFTAYVAYGGQFGLSGIPTINHIWKTTNLNAGTPTWTATANGIPDVPVNALAVDPDNSNDVYAGTDIGVYKSTDAGATWNPFGLGLPKMAVFEMAIQDPFRILRIATHGRGFWEIRIPGIAAPSPGDLLISEFRVRGPNGANDEFVELYNASGAQLTVQSADASAGLAVAASDGAIRCTVPNGTVIPAGGHYLCVNSVGYSLASYPAGDGTTATGDATYTTDIPDNAGIALFNNATPANFTMANRLDAVGSTSEANTLYKEGTGYPALTPFSIDYSFYRDNCGKQGSITSAAPCSRGIPGDTNNNAVDFIFVDTNGTSAGAGQRLGAPGPENNSAPLVKDGSSVVPSLLDSCAAATASPNVERSFTSDPPNNSTFGTVDVRATYTNNTGASLTRLRFRILDQTTFPAPSGTADLRARTSTDLMVNVDRPPCGSGTSSVLVHGTTLEQPPNSPNGTAFNGSLSAGSVTQATPLANGASIDVRFLLGIQQTGTARFCVASETLPDSGSQVYCFNGTVADCGGITCPANVVTNSGPGQNSAVVTYPAPTANGSCGTINCSPASGSTFPTGTTTVNCTSTAGPACSFTVTVRPPRYWSTTGSTGTTDEDSIAIVGHDDFAVQLKDTLTGTATVRYNITAVRGISSFCPATTSTVNVRFRNSDNTGANAQVKFEIHRTNILAGGNDIIFTFNSNGLGAGSAFTTASMAPNIDFDFSNYIYWIEATIYRNDPGLFADLGSVEIYESAGTPCP